LRRADGREQILRIVGEGEANPARGTISQASPIARAVLGCKIGDSIAINGEGATIIGIK
jgi:transcription elongation GreA/GreB family factor